MKRYIWNFHLELLTPKVPKGPGIRHPVALGLLQADAVEHHELLKFAKHLLQLLDPGSNERKVIRPDQHKNSQLIATDGGGAPPYVPKILERLGAGCIAIELECVPAKVAAEMARRTKMLVFSMGSGPDGDGQFIFAEDLLGSNSGHYPRHSITYSHMYKDAVKALGQYKDDVVSGAYPAAKHSIGMKDEEYAEFLARVRAIGGSPMPDQRVLLAMSALGAFVVAGLCGWKQR